MIVLIVIVVLVVLLAIAVRRLVQPVRPPAQPRRGVLAPDRRRAAPSPRPDPEPGRDGQGLRRPRARHVRGRHRRRATPRPPRAPRPPSRPRRRTCSPARCASCSRSPRRTRSSRRASSSRSCSSRSTETEDRIAAGRRFYNGNVRALNVRVESFPSSIIANDVQLQEGRVLRGRGPGGARRPDRPVLSPSAVPRRSRSHGRRTACTIRRRRVDLAVPLGPTSKFFRRSARNPRHSPASSDKVFRTTARTERHACAARPTRLTEDRWAATHAPRDRAGRSEVSPDREHGPDRWSRSTRSRVRRTTHGSTCATRRRSATRPPSRSVWSPSSTAPTRRWSVASSRRCRTTSASATPWPASCSRRRRSPRCCSSSRPAGSPTPAAARWSSRSSSSPGVC